MKKLTPKAVIFLILALIGLFFAFYSIAAKNYILLIVAILFTTVSADNIFCNLKYDENGNARHN